MEILGVDRGWVGNECGPDRRVGHGYDRKAAFTSKNSMDMYFSLGWAHVSYMNLQRRWMESVVVRPGRPPKWVVGSILWVSARWAISSATQEERILAIVSSSAMGRYAFVSM